MGSCLKTQLKAAVSNETLIKLGSFRIGVSYTEGATGLRTLLNFKNSKQMLLEVKGNGHIGDYGGSINETSKIISANTQTAVGFENADYEVEISEKETLSMFALGTLDTSAIFVINVDDLKYSPITFSRLQGKTVTGNISSLANVTQLGIKHTGIIGDIACFTGKALNGTDKISGTNYYDLRLQDSPIYGDITSLGGIDSNVRRLRINDTDIEGTLESFATILKDKLANGSTFEVNASNSKVKYQGVNITADSLIITIDSSAPGGYVIN